MATYRLKQPAERMEETRRRIAKATFELHGTVGPAYTTIAAIARRAGVQRLTVHRHSPDLTSLLRACTRFTC
jgi:AcrR family transcriptional regulator